MLHVNLTESHHDIFGPVVSYADNAPISLYLGTRALLRNNFFIDMLINMPIMRKQSSKQIIHADNLNMVTDS